MGHERRIVIDLDREVQTGAIIDLDEQTRHYLFNVLRLRGNHPVTAITRNGKLVLDCLTTTNQALTVKAVSGSANAATQVATIGVALAKGSTNDFVLEKAVELGVQNLIIWSSERSIVKIGSQEDLAKKLRRWGKIIEAAATQAGLQSLPRLQFCASVTELIDAVNQLAPPLDRRLVCSLASTSKPINKIPTINTPVHVIVGPEGDFTADEEQLLFTQKYEPLSLGNTRLKVDTAAIAAISLIEGAALVGSHLISSNLTNSAKQT